MPDPQPEFDPSTTPLPLSYWLMTGGTGPPPSSWSIFHRLASERKAAHREAAAWSRRRAAARAEFEREWRAEAEQWKKKKNRPRRREELMARFGPQGTERDRGDAGGGGGEGVNSGVNSKPPNPKDRVPSAEGAPGDGNNSSNSNNDDGRGRAAPPDTNEGGSSTDRPGAPGDTPAQEQDGNHDDANDGGDGGGAGGD
ncbi:hypothetical protein F4775DRAFT_461332 [Biscogniauxia sp. FL1348]|nr:hypothetical protein F4775DRAFT_461332 [Biscogniauxia sp. FL1348]